MRAGETRCDVLAVMAIVVMGVSGSGKSTVASALAGRLDRACLDADDLHPVVNVDKMARGEPLTDVDRAPWLDAVVVWIDAHEPSVVACSALRRAHRDRLRAAAGAVTFVHLDPPADVLRARLTHRQGHFMPASQLADQLATLEPLEPDEGGLRVIREGSVDETVAAILGMIDARETR